MCDISNKRFSRSAAELDELFERKIKPWNFSKTETATQRLVRSSENAGTNS
jgi:hypothetical protein